MALTVSNLQFESAGPRTRAVFQIAFDNSYPTGGELLLPAQLGLTDIISFNVVGDEGGLEFDYDYTNKKVKVFLSAGAAHQHAQQGLTEVVPVAANVGAYTLIFSPLVGNVTVTAGAVTGPYLLVREGAVPGINQVAQDYTLGTLTFNAGDAVTSCTIRYMSNVTAMNGGGAASEVPNGTDLSALTAVECVALTASRYHPLTA